MAFRSLFLALLYSSLPAANAVTVYNQLPLGASATTAASSAVAASYTGSAAYDPTILTPPAIPDPPPATNFALNLMPAADQVNGISIETASSFFGISIEMSVATQVIGKNSSFVNVPFLNLMSLLAERSGEVIIRVGGNTQDYATMVDSTSDGRVIEKQGIDPNNPTATPTLVFTSDLMYLLRNASSFVNIKWYLGVPFNNTEDIHLQIVESGEQILGDTLLGYQVGNEPDLYANHQHRASTYGPMDYYTEFGEWKTAWQADANIPVKNNMIGPSLSLANWALEDVWNTPFLTDYADVLTALSVEHYPADNCAAIYAGLGTPVEPQAIFSDYLTHQSGINIVKPMLNSTMIAQTVQKPFIMFETNTASCGGFKGVSNSFGSALWGLDYGLQMVFSNFTHAFVHVGGQSVYYNPFTPPPTNQSAFHQWTVGPIFYSLLIMPEILGKSNTSRVVDLWPNSGNELTPGYGIYENNQLARVALFNYMTDPTGAMEYTANISIGGGTTGQPQSVPASVTVKYLLADSVSQLFNITWANRTFGEQFGSDGRLLGDEEIVTVQCDQQNLICPIKVPAPGFALVMMTDTAAQGSEPAATETFSTSALTKTVNTVTIDASAMATSNGHSGKDRLQSGSTSKGSSSAARAAGIAPSVTILVAMLAGAGVLMKTFAH